MITISLEGVSSVGGTETRALAHLKVIMNGVEYLWKAYIPENMSDLPAFITNITPVVEAQIIEKEAIWEALTPKTRTVPGMFGEEATIVAINKEEIVKPDIPDYYALRRDSYPSIGEQLGALWKGPNNSEYAAVLAQIQLVKDTYPKSDITV